MKTVFIIFSLSWLLCSCSATSDENKPAPAANNPNMVTLTDTQLNTAGITTGHPEIRRISSVLKVNGLVDVPPQNMVTYSFPYGGYLKSTDLLPGMLVRKGQLIGVMEDASFIQLQQDYLMAESKLNYLQKDFLRQQQLNVNKTASDKVFQQAQSDYEMEKVSVSALRQKLLLLGIDPSGLTASTIRRTVAIRSPITGFVMDVRVNVGKYVNPTDVIFDLVNTNDLHLALTVFEKDLPFVHIGQKVEAYAVNDTAKAFAAEIILVSRAIDSNRSATVHCHFLKEGPKLIPGMFMNADIQIRSDSGIAVPEDAVVRSDDHQYVFVQRKPGQFELVQVNGTIHGEGYTLLENQHTLRSSDLIITKNAYPALMKMKNTGGEE